MEIIILFLNKKIGLVYNNYIVLINAKIIYNYKLIYMRKINIKGKKELFNNIIKKYIKGRKLYNT